MPGQEDGVMTNLFEGARFWVSQHVPQQSKIKELIKVIASLQVLKEKTKLTMMIAKWRRGKFN